LPARLASQPGYTLNMLTAIIEFSLKNRLLVIVASLGLALAGAWSLRFIDVDAFPDTTPVQVQINTTAPALSPEEVERQITIPLENEIGGLPQLAEWRSVSKFGFSQVVATFEDGTDVYFARQLISERLATVDLPEGVGRATMGPVATGLGEVFHYAIVPAGGNVENLAPVERLERLTELRTVQDWIIKPRLRQVPGVAEVNGWGGYEKQFQVLADPQRLIQHGLTFDDLAEALAANNQNVGGGSLRRNTQMVLVHGQGRVENADQIRAIVVAASGGVPIRVGDVADVRIGHAIRRGAVTADGQGEAVLGLGFMLMGENSHEVTRALKNELEAVRASLPPGVKVETLYDRTELVDHVLDTVRANLFEGGLLVVAVLFAFLGNLRAAFIVALAIPLSMLAAFSGMARFGIAASLLSLGAIDFGLVVDSSVVMVENCARHLARAGKNTADSMRTVLRAALEVRKPTMFGELIIMIVYLPILTLEGVEGKLFRPMALTVIFALAGSMILSMTLMPVLASLLLPGRIHEREPFLAVLARRMYAPVLHLTMRYKGAVIGLAAMVLLVAYGFIAPNLGAEFVPRLAEGAIAINVVRLAGTDLEESIRANTQLERALLAEFPDEIEHVFSRIGTAEVATDPMGVELTDVFITLKSRNRWRRASTQAQLTERIEESLRHIPGQRLAFTQPIEMRVQEMISGVRTDVAVKIFGDDYAVLADRATQVERVLRTIRGSADVSSEQITGQPVMTVRVDQDAMGRYGVPAHRVLEVVEAVGGRPLGEVVQGEMRFPLVVRLPEQAGDPAEAVARLLIATPSGERIPLGRLANVATIEGPSTITREGGRRRITVTANVRGRDLGTFVAEARRHVAAEVSLPAGRYHMEWGGEFENLERGQRRLLIVVPLALGLIFGLLYLTYRNVPDTIRVFTGVPFAWTGGIFALWLRDMPFSISAAIGFVALSGVAVLDDMLLVSYIRQLRARGAALDAAVEGAALTRLRPILMTTLVASLGFVPMAFNTSMGAEVQRPLATVVIGGVISSMVMSLLVLRVLYVVFNAPVRSDDDEAGQWLDSEDASSPQGDSHASLPVAK
jgi:cobalt-zinc-cadmium resistance protein CzcA